MDPDDLDDPLGSKEAELEARFRELEHQAEVERLRTAAGGGAHEPASATEPPSAGSAGGGHATASNPDPLGDLKAAVSGEAKLERYLLVLCPHCQAKNRMSLTKVRTLGPICGRCKKDLSFTKY